MSTDPDMATPEETRQLIHELSKKYLDADGAQLIIDDHDNGERADAFESLVGALHHAGTTLSEDEVVRLHRSARGLGLEAVLEGKY